MESQPSACNRAGATEVPLPAVVPANARAVSAAVRSITVRAARVTALISEALALRNSFPPLAEVVPVPEAAALRLTFLSLPAEAKFSALLPIGEPHAACA